MADLTFTFNSDEVTNFSHTVNVAEADADRITTAFAAIWASEFVDENGEEFVPTKEQIIALWIQKTLSGALGLVRRYEQDEARKAAEAQIQDIQLS